MKKYILAIDNGTQSSKVVVFDLQGNQICQGVDKLKPLVNDKFGNVEHPEDSLWDSIINACNRCLESFKNQHNGNIEDIMGVGLCTIRFCRCLLKEDGSLASPVMSWMDKRVSKPHAEDNPAIKYVTTSSGYITHKLTGKFNDTVANYLGCWPLDLDNWRWNDDVENLRNFNLTKDMLFNLQMPGTILGEITKEASLATGLPIGMPVIATSNDKAVEALGAGLYNSDTILVSLGTYITSMIVGEYNHPGSKNIWTNFACMPYKYLYESGGIRRGMWTVSWVKDLLGEDLLKRAQEKNLSPEDYLNQLATGIKAGSEGLMCVLDWLAPVDAPFKKGMFIGFDGRHGAGHLYKAVLEGIALSMKNNVDGICTDLSIIPKNILISGGGSNGDTFMQIFADVFGLPVGRNVVNGSASLGAAICVAVALGQYGDFEKAIAAMVKLDKVFKPNEPNTKLYHRYNEEVYKHITNHTDNILRKSYDIFS